MKKMRFLCFIGVASIVAGLALMGCSTNNEDATTVTATPAAAPSPATNTTAPAPEQATMGKPAK